MVIGRASDLHVNEVTAAAPTGRAPEWGGQTWGADVTVPCLIEETYRQVKAPSGEDAMSSTQIHAAPEYGAVLAPGCRVTLPVAPHRPAVTVTYVISTQAIVTGDAATDGVVAMCE